MTPTTGNDPTYIRAPDGHLVRAPWDLSVQELQSEIARHHRDFAKISAIIDAAFDGAGSVDCEYKRALRQIRGIVG